MGLACIELIQVQNSISKFPSDFPEREIHIIIFNTHFPLRENGNTLFYNVFPLREFHISILIIKFPYGEKGPILYKIVYIPFPKGI